jgi:hypothetical protein
VKAHPFFYHFKTNFMLTSEQIQLLKQQDAVKKLSAREERYAYYGLLSEYQLHSKEELMKLDYGKLNPYQHFLFKRVLHGLNVYSQEEIEKLHWDKKKRIKKVWQRAQDVLNIWKQSISNKKINDYLYKTFGEKAKDIVEIPADEYLPDYKNKLSLKDLGLTYEDVILKFISEGLLPRNFLSLNSDVPKQSIKENG